jgi:hypothetical protein
MVVLLKRALEARSDSSLAHPRARFDIRRATILAATGLSTTVVGQKNRISAEQTPLVRHYSWRSFDFFRKRDSRVRSQRWLQCT